MPKQEEIANLIKDIDKHLNTSAGLSYRDIQLFIKIKKALQKQKGV